MRTLQGPARILGGLPVWAICWYTLGDGWSEDDDAGVDSLYWLKRDGTKGAPLSKKILDRLDRTNPHWECDVCDQVFDDHAEAHSQKSEDKQPTFELVDLL